MIRGDGSLEIDTAGLDSSFLSLLEARGLRPDWSIPERVSGLDVPQATTVLAMRFGDGVAMAGDRRATAGNVIAHRRVKKVYATDDYSAVAISGTAGMAIEMTKLFQTELEHYEKIEGTRLSLEGKANYLARMIRGNLAMAFQGLAVVPLFCGYDLVADTGRLFSFDVVGGRYEEQDYATTGSGGAEAKAFIKTVYRPDMTGEETLRVAVEALVAAAEEDSATGGPDIRRGIYPNVVMITTEGVTEVEDEVLSGVAAEVLEGRP